MRFHLLSFACTSGGEGDCPSSLWLGRTLSRQTSLVSTAWPNVLRNMLQEGLVKACLPAAGSDGDDIAQLKSEISQLGFEVDQLELTTACSKHKPARGSNWEGKAV